MSKPGLFIIKKFRGKEIEIWTSHEGEVIKYNDTDTYSWCVITGIVIEYDKETDILTLATKNGDLLYLNSDNIESFWQPGINIRDFTKNTMNLPGPKKRNSI